MSTKHIEELIVLFTNEHQQRRHLVSFAGTWLLRRSTKEVAYTHSKLQIKQIEKVQRTAARWTCRKWRNTSSVGEMFDELEARRDHSSLLLFHKIHCRAVSIEKDKYMTPANSLKTTRSSHNAQYRRHQTNSDALKNSSPPPPEIFHIGIVCRLL